LRCWDHRVAENNATVNCWVWPEVGTVEIAGRQFAGQGVAARQRCLGMVFQDYALFPHLVAENVAFGLRLL